MNATAIGVIPARYGSTRLPAKALAMLRGKPLVQHVYERAKQARRLSDVIVATDDERIVRAVEQAGGRAMMTSPTLRSGTDRVADVARQLDARVIVNIQGDEPLIRPEQIDQVAEFLLAHQAVPMATLMTRFAPVDDVSRPHVVKVVTDRDGYALYFSRSPIPFIRDPFPTNGSRSTIPESQATSDKPRATTPSAIYWKHLGIYAYQRDFVLRFPHLPPTPLEQAEQLEQLRALEHGFRIKVLETPFDTIGVDTAEDLQRVEQLLANA